MLYFRLAAASNLCKKINTMKYFSIIALALVLGTSCKSPKEGSTVATDTSKTGTQGTTATTTASTPKNAGTATAADSLYRLTVSFYSIGSGTEHEFITGFEDKIGSYSAKIGKNIDYSKSHWGREGETDFCLSLKELTNDQQAEFVEITKNYLKDAKWVHVNENAPCLHQGRR